MKSFEELKKMNEEEQQKIAKEIIEDGFHNWAQEKSNRVIWEEYEKVEKMPASKIKIIFLDDRNFHEVDADCKFLDEPIRISE